MNTIKIFRPAFLNPLCKALGLSIGDLCVLSRRSFDGEREIWAVGLVYGGRRFPHIILGEESGASISWIKSAIGPAVELVQRAFLLPQYEKYATRKVDALLCGYIELGYSGGLHLAQESSTM